MVANRKSQDMCANLIYSIRESGCKLPIRLIHFGGEEICSAYVLNEVELLRYGSFSKQAKAFVADLRSVLTDCPLGFLYRYLAWFSDWDEFIYADNDIVALCNWEVFFDFLSDYDLVHADEEYTTKGVFNYNRPELVQSIFGVVSLESAITAGHFATKRNSKMIDDINKAVAWFKQYPDIPKKHDQSLLHVASMLGSWKMLNLCKPPHNWLSTWAGDYRNSLQLIQRIQKQGSSISHIHYSGGTPKGDDAIQDLLLSMNNKNERLAKITLVSFKFFSGFERINNYYSRVKRFVKNKIS